MLYQLQTLWKKSKKLLFVLTLLFILLILDLDSKFYFSFRTKNNQKDEQITIEKKLEIKYYSDEETGQKFYIEEEEFRSKRSILYPESVDKEGGINKFSTSCEETVNECWKWLHKELTEIQKENSVNPTSVEEGWKEKIKPNHIFTKSIHIKGEKIDIEEYLKKIS